MIPLRPSRADGNTVGIHDQSTGRCRCATSPPRRNTSYEGAKPVPKGYNTKRRHAQRGRDDTVVTDYHARVVCFASGDPSGLSVTLPPPWRSYARSSARTRRSYSGSTGVDPTRRCSGPAATPTPTG